MSNKIKDDLAFIRVINRFVKHNIWSLVAFDYHNGVKYDIQISVRKIKV